MWHAHYSFLCFVGIEGWFLVEVQELKLIHCVQQTFHHVPSESTHYHSVILLTIFNLLHTILVNLSQNTSNILNKEIT